MGTVSSGVVDRILDFDDGSESVERKICTSSFEAAMNLYWPDAGTFIVPSILSVEDDLSGL